MLLSTPIIAYFPCQFPMTNKLWRIEKQTELLVYNSIGLFNSNRSQVNKKKKTGMGLRPFPDTAHFQGFQGVYVISQVSLICLSVYNVCTDVPYLFGFFFFSETLSSQQWLYIFHVIFQWQITCEKEKLNFLFTIGLFNPYQS